MPYIALDPNTAVQIPDPSPNPASPKTGMGITLVAAREELRAMLKGRTDVEKLRLDFWLNRAYTDLATSMKKPDELKYSIQFSTTVDQAHYLLPELVTTTLNLARVDDDNLYGGVPLEKKDLVWYRRQKKITNTAERKPTAFFRLDRQLILWPTPSAVYDLILDFRYEPQPLSADDDSPILRKEWHEAWLILARKKILSAISEWEASMAVGNEFVGHMRVRQDREGGEEENKIVSSSVPTSNASLRRRQLESQFIDRD